MKRQSNKQPALLRRDGSAKPTNPLPPEPVLKIRDKQATPTDETKPTEPPAELTDLRPQGAALRVDLRTLLGEHAAPPLQVLTFRHPRPSVDLEPFLLRAETVDLGSQPLAFCDGLDPEPLHSTAIGVHPLAILAHPGQDAPEALDLGDEPLAVPLHRPGGRS